MSRRSSVSSSNMEVDTPASAALKRSNSAPMINNTVDMASTSAATSTIEPASASPLSHQRDGSLFNILGDIVSPARTRRFSASSSSSPHGNSNGPRLTPRVNQLRQEECVDLAGREVAHEREVHSAMQMSQSCEDLTVGGLEKQRLRVTDPLHVSLPSAPPLCSSPSPTRSVRHVPSLPFWNLSPSPTRKAFATRRSLSPIALRPSSLGAVKRKFEADDESYGSPSSKRLSCGAQRLSPLPGTPESISSADSPSGFFRPVDSPSSLIAPSPSQSSSTSHADEPMPDVTIHKDIVMAAAVNDH